MKLGVALGPRVLLGNLGPELDVGAHSFPEQLVSRQTGLIERLHVQSHEPLPLLVRDLQMPVHINDVLEAKLAAETVRPTEGFRREPGQVIHMLRAPLRKQRLQDGSARTLE